MPYCPDCKTECLPEHKFCGVCGAGLASVSNQTFPRTQSDFTLPYYISITKIISMSFLSNGLYLFYWFYITWKQYHETTDETVYPVWHALSLIIPIYNLFRIHRHVGTFKTLMSNSNLPNSLNPFSTIGVFIILSLLDWFSFQTAMNDITDGTIVTASCLNLLSAAGLAGMLIQLQRNLNRYWNNLPHVKARQTNLTSAKVTMPEIILIGIGVLTWLEPLMLIWNRS